jgi:hypothetical protein
MNALTSSVTVSLCLRRIHRRYFVISGNKADKGYISSSTFLKARLSESKKKKLGSPTPDGMSTI